MIIAEGMPNMSKVAGHCAQGVSDQLSLLDCQAPILDMGPRPLYVTLQFLRIESPKENADTKVVTWGIHCASLVQTPCAIHHTTHTTHHTSYSRYASVYNMHNAPYTIHHAQCTTQHAQHTIYHIHHTLYTEPRKLDGRPMHPWKKICWSIACMCEHICACMAVAAGVCLILFLSFFWTFAKPDSSSASHPLRLRIHY